MSQDFRKGDIVSVQGVVEEVMSDGDVCVRMDGRSSSAFLYKPSDQVTLVERKEWRSGDQIGRAGDGLANYELQRQFEGGWIAKNIHSSRRIVIEAEELHEWAIFK